MSGQTYYEHLARAEWTRARQKATVQQLVDRLRSRRKELVPFDFVRRLVTLRGCQSLGIQEVPLDKIVGSVGRHYDFTGTFLPRAKHLRQRWQRISALVSSVGAPPVVLLKVADAYFVLDGNHRTSVARAHGAPTIEAEVCEFAVDPRIGEGTSLAERLLACWWIEACYESMVSDLGLANACP